MEKINVPGVPAVSSLKSEGRGMEIIGLIQRLGDLTEEQRNEMLRTAFAKTVAESLAKNSNEGLLEVLQHCNLAPSTITETDKVVWNHRLSLFRIAYDQIVANAKPVPSAKKNNGERRDWKNPELLNKFIDAVKASKTGTFKDIGETFGGLEPSQVMSVLEGLRTGKYAGVGFPAKEYDIHLPRQKGRKASA
jgi:hypothetical protein